MGTFLWPGPSLPKLQRGVAMIDDLVTNYHRAVEGQILALLENGPLAVHDIVRLTQQIKPSYTESAVKLALWRMIRKEQLVANSKE